jgi:hypothetical protein
MLEHESDNNNMPLFLRSLSNNDEAHLQEARHLQVAIPQARQGEPLPRQDQVRL